MKKYLLIAGICLVSVASNAQAPAGYYNATANLSCAPLKTALKTITTNGNNAQAYASLYNQYALTDKKPRTVGTGSADVVYDIYSTKPNGTDPYQFAFTKTCGSYSGEGDCFNREHSVPQSWFGGNTSVPGPTTDYLHIYPTDGFVNGKRSNFPYGEVASVSYTSQNGSKLGTSAVAGVTGTVFEPVDEFKGDVARAFLYFVTRYQDDMTSFATNSDAKQSFDANTFPSVKVAYLQLMLKWHNQDPVSEKERIRNNGSYSFQGNRNPYVDSPQFVNRVWNKSCPGLGTLPVNLVYFTGKLIGNKVVLNWESENETNFYGYDVERSINGNSFSRVASIKASGNGNYNFNDDANALRGYRVYYRLKKLDKDGSYSYSEIFSLHIGLNTRFTVYPNPANKFFNVQVSNNLSGRATVIITDLSGKQVHNQVVNLTNGLVLIPTNNLQNGTYIFKMQLNNEEYISKVVVSK